MGQVVSCRYLFIAVSWFLMLVIYMVSGELLRGLIESSGTKLWWCAVFGIHHVTGVTKEVDI